MSESTEELGFDQTLIALKQVVEQLESGSLSLEASLQSFEEGIRLARRGTHILDAAEHRVEVLTSTSADTPAPDAPVKIEQFTPSSP